MGVIAGEMYKNSDVSCGGKQRCCGAIPNPCVNLMYGAFDNKIIILLDVPAKDRRE